MPSRREFLSTSAAGALAGGLTMVAPGLSVGAAPIDRRFVVVILRGGLDGLAAIPPFGDPNLTSLRPRILPPAPGASGGALPLSGGFALHPGLADLHPLWESRQLAVIHAVGTGGRSRSHFDAQDMLENGTTDAKGARDGWLNRALAAMEARRGISKTGLSVGPNVPLLMRGDTRIRTWSPNALPPADPAFLDRLTMIYKADPMFARAFAEARTSARVAARAMGRRQRGKGLNRFENLAASAGKLLAQPDGPRIASLEMGGWDTHVGQKNALNRRLPRLARGLVKLREALGGHWSNTAVLVVTEFGRTARENGSRGTDHGTGGVALVLGGAVNGGGRVRGRWPGLSDTQLLQGRDLRPTTDMRAVCKGLLRDHLSFSERMLAGRVFPDSASVRPMSGLIRRS